MIRRVLLRNGAHGYGAVTKVLHWLTVLAVAAQFAIGVSMDPGAAAERADAQVDVFEDRGEDAAERQGEAAEERFEAEVRRREAAADALEGSSAGLTAHVVVGLLVLLLGVARLVWRRTTPLPPWAEHLGAGERRVESWSEKALLALLLGVPLTGLVLRHTVVRRHRHLSRML